MCVWIFLFNFFFETFLILRWIQRENVINVHTVFLLSTRYSCQIFMTLFLDTFFEKILEYQVTWKTRPVGAEVFHADGQTDTYDEANGRFSQLCERA
jgi:hypothetical protein